MGQDIKCQLNGRVKSGKYALQLDESTDVSGVTQLIVFVRCIRYIDCGNHKEELLMCVSYLEHTQVKTCSQKWT